MKQRLWLIACLTVFLYPASGLWADENPIGLVKEFEGDVLANTSEGAPFTPVKSGLPLFKGGAIIVLDDASVTLQITGKGNLHLTDNAAVKLQDVAVTGEFTRVTGVRAPVLFLYPTGQSDEVCPGKLRLAFGINHSLDKIQGVPTFSVWALHEDDEDELSDDAALSRRLGKSVLLKTFSKMKVPRKDGYSWYSFESTTDLIKEGDYLIFLTGVRGDETLSLGQSTMVYVAGEDE